MKILFNKIKPISTPPSSGSTTFLISLLALALAFTLVISFSFSDLKYYYEERIGALIWSAFPEQEREQRIIIVAIDEQSLASVGPWPWSRATMTNLSNRIAEYGSSLQLYDIVFPEAKANDDAFLQALEKNNAVLAQIPIFNGQSPIRNGQLNGAFDKARCEYPIPKSQSYLANTPSLAIRNVGHITPIIDRDGVIRKQPPLICIDGQVYPSLALEGLLSSLDSNYGQVGASIIQNSSWLSSPWKVVIDSYFGLSIPVDQEGNMRLSYRQSPDSFQVVSASSVLDGSAPKTLFDNTWTLIGATAFGLGDIVPTPHSGTAPGVELQARLLSNLLDGRTPYTPVYSSYILILFGMCVSISLLLLARMQNKVSSYALPAAAIIFPVMAWLLHSYLLSFDIWIGWFNTALFSLLSGLFFVLADHQVLRHQHLRIFSHLSSYLPKSVAHSLLNQSPSGSIEAKRHDLVLLCADIRNFSAYEESRSPEEAAALLHCFFVEATRVIEESGGQIEEYKGDSILASWKVDSVGSATQAAVNTSAALQEVITGIIPQRPPKGLEPLALGIAIERGPTLVGSIGPAHRRHHTLLGDTVTIVLRIQEMTQDLAQPILIGECAARDLKGEQVESQGSFLLDGLTTPHVLFAPRSHHIDPLMDHDCNRILKIVRGH